MAPEGEGPNKSKPHESPHERTIQFLERVPTGRFLAALLVLPFVVMAARDPEQFRLLIQWLFNETMTRVGGWIAAAIATGAFVVRERAHAQTIEAKSARLRRLEEMLLGQARPSLGALPPSMEDRPQEGTR